MTETGEDVEVAFRPRSLFDLIERNVFAKNTHMAITVGEDSSKKSVSYSELALRSKSIASGLSGLGVKEGDRVGALLPNGIEFVELWLASSLLGAVFVPFNFALKGSMLEFQLKDSEVSVLCYDQRFAKNLPAESLPKNIANAVAVDGSHSGTRERYNLPPGVLETSFEELAVRGVISGASLPAPNPELPACILYTSGTTGEPKGVVLTHGAYLNRTLEVCNLLEAKKGSVFFNTLPMFHTSGQVMTTLPAFFTGGTVVIEEWFHASRFWRIARERRASYSFLLMTMINALLKKKEEHVENNLEVILCGGASHDAWIEFEKSFNVKLLEGFGMTETCAIAIYNRIDGYRIGSIGKPLPSVEARIVDDEDRVISEPRKPGELCLRPKIPGSMMTEYYKKPSETSEVWRGSWLHTGDVCFKDSDGYFFFVERKKDIIRRKGENIAPSDIERTVSRHPAILECCAVGIKSELGEEDVALNMVLKEPLGDSGQFLKWLDKELPFYMIPKIINIVESLPKTANLKIQRAQVKEGKVNVVSSIDVEKSGFKPSRPPLL